MSTMQSEYFQKKDIKEQVRAKDKKINYATIFPKEHDDFSANQHKCMTYENLFCDG